VETYFRINEIPIGRYKINISYPGYEPQIISSILVTSGKQLVLNLELLATIKALEQVVVKASESDKAKPLNEMASVSARPFFC